MGVSICITDKGQHYHDVAKTIEGGFNRWDAWTYLDALSQDDDGTPQPSYVDMDAQFLDQPLRVAWGAPCFEIGVRIAREGGTIALIHVLSESILGNNEANQQHMMFVTDPWWRLTTPDDPHMAVI